MADALDWQVRGRAGLGDLGKLYLYPYTTFLAMEERVLVITHSAGFRHGYLPVAVDVLEELGEEGGLFRIHATDDCSEIDERRLDGYSALLFLTSGELPLERWQKKALTRFVEKGGGFVGVHSAADTLYSFPEYGQMLGGYFNGHPWTQEVYVIVEDRSHPSTAHLPRRFKVVEEIYTFRDWSRDRTNVLMSLDTSSVDLSKGTRKDNDYALAWYHYYGRGRVFYTALGHFQETWRAGWYKKHILGGITWVLKK